GRQHTAAAAERVPVPHVALHRRPAERRHGAERRTPHRPRHRRRGGRAQAAWRGAPRHCRRLAARGPGRHRAHGCAPDGADRGRAPRLRPLHRHPHRLARRAGEAQPRRGRAAGGLLLPHRRPLRNGRGGSGLDEQGDRGRRGPAAAVGAGLRRVRGAL
ncbi:MAG: hypothetical protein AVDCRST_MAG04-3283, partial [uncultured Acetobacteraceae bacterium]